MKDLRVKLRRQAELLCKVLSSDEKLTTTDLAFEFGCEELTIKRDMQELRAREIDIHSKASKGVEIDSAISDEKLKEIISGYFAITVEEDNYNKATALLVKKQKYNALKIITSLQKGIEKALKVKLLYNKPYQTNPNSYLLEPLMVFQSENSWRLLARDGNLLKQFLLNRMKEIEVTDKKFRKPSKSTIQSIFNTSFKSWLGDDRYNVVLKVEEPWATRLKPTQLMEVQKMTENNDGSITLELVVNSLGEISSWIVAKGKGVTVVEPEELRNNVIDIAKGVLENYK